MAQPRAIQGYFEDVETHSRFLEAHSGAKEVKYYHIIWTAVSNIYSENIF
jgi:hypothetical protein